jgi:arylformamidase
MPERGSDEHRKWLDAEYSPSQTARDAAGSMRAGREKAELARAHFQARGTHRVLSYGPKRRNQVELFLLEGAHKPAFLMLHGGWWQEGSIDDGARYARAVTEIGAQHIAVGYTLAPEATLDQIVDEAAAAVSYVIAHALELGCDPDRIYVGGHSAGAHLAATLVTDLVPTHVREGIAGLLLIGGAYDLAPIAESYVNDLVGMSAEDAHRLSPAFHLPTRRIPVTVRVGELEPSEFHRQSATLTNAWGGAAKVVSGVVPDRDHFDLLDELDTSGGSLQEDLRALSSGQTS